MTAADYQKTHHSPLIPLLAKFDELAAADQYRALAEAYAAFIKEHEHHALSSRPSRCRSRSATIW